MSINATTSSSSVSSSSSSTQVSSSASTESTKKSSTDSSFKDEMDKVSTSDQKTEDKNNTTVSDKNEKSSNQENSNKQDDNNLLLEGNADYSNFASMSVLDANSMLTSDIMQMMGLNAVEQTDSVSGGSMTLDFGNTTNQVSMTESDANFFLSLTQNNDVSAQNITAQAQSMLNNGAEVAEVKQNVQISQTLLNAINTAKENNQPLRIDFDQNVSVILRINKDGAISANFIPGDKAVEQYLKNNLANLKATFEEQDLPYSDLSYSNRGGKQQKEQRRNNGK
jgi:hypothetical protein